MKWFKKVESELLPAFKYVEKREKVDLYLNRITVKFKDGTEEKLFLKDTIIDTEQRYFTNPYEWSSKEHKKYQDRYKYLELNCKSIKSFYVPNYHQDYKGLTEIFADFKSILINPEELKSIVVDKEKFDEGETVIWLVE